MLWFVCEWLSTSCEVLFDQYWFPEHYKRELWVSSQSGHHTIQSDLISANLGELREDLEKLQATHQHTDGTTAELQVVFWAQMEHRRNYIQYFIAISRKLS